MIIKKRKNKDNNIIKDSSENSVVPQAEEKTDSDTTNIFDALEEVKERQERRRGDRRRGYRRIEDRSLVSRAQEEAKIIKEQASLDGFKNGLQKADKEISSLQEAITSILSVKQEAYTHFQNDIIAIALEVAKKILNAQVDVNPETIVEITKNVIKEISEDDNKITFIINPTDELVLKNNLETNSAFKNKRATMLVQTDDRVEKGSCKVVTNSGQIDATFTSQLAIIKKAFEEGM